jgi:hypothetical protein
MNIHISHWEQQLISLKKSAKFKSSTRICTFYPQNLPIQKVQSKIIKKCRARSSKSADQDHQKVQTKIIKHICVIWSWSALFATQLVHILKFLNRYCWTSPLKIFRVVRVKNNPGKLTLWQKKGSFENCIAKVECF